MKRRTWLRTGLGTLLGVPALQWGLAGCSAPRDPVQVALNAWVGYGLLHLAAELDYLSEGEARLQEFPSNTASMMALVEGRVPAAALTLDELLQVREGGVDARAILVFDESHGADVVMAHPSVVTLAHLRGKRIGVETTALGALMLSRLLAAAGVSAADVVKVPVTADHHVGAYAEREVDVVITFEPMVSQLRAQGAHALLDSRKLPGLIVDVLAVRADAIPDQVAEWRHLLQGYFRAFGHWRDQPEVAARLMAPHQQLSAEQVLQAFAGIAMADLAGNRAWLAGENARLYQSAKLVGRVMHESRLLDRMPDLDALCEPRFLPEAA